LLARFALVQDADYFQVLGLSRQASGEEIERAHQRLADEVRPERITPAVAAALAHEIAVVRRVLSEAIRVLGDEGMRRSYRDHLVTPASPGNRGP
jgi:DnaJ-class molecular chaperone